MATRSSRRRRPGLLTLAGVAVLACPGLITACTVPPPSVKTTGTAPSTQALGAKGHASPAKIGSTIDLTGNSSGQQIAVTVVKVISRAHGADMFSTPDHGMRFFAVQFRLRNIGKAAYSDSPSNGAQVADAAGQSYQADLSNVRHCQSFPGSEVLSPGATGLGCVVFQVGRHARITRIQFTLYSGFASDSGQWKVQL